MKRSLLLSFCNLAILSAMAYSDPTEYKDTEFYGISPNGQYIYGGYGKSGFFTDLKTNDTYEFEQDPVTNTAYYPGLGHCISNDGLLLLADKVQSDPTYFYQGEWYVLDFDGTRPNSINMANAITPDGSRICGSLAVDEPNASSKALSLIPVVWDRDEDGSYGKYTVLPHPQVDLTNRLALYITATQISDDGKTVLGQIINGYGTAPITPIVYKQDENGEWSYKLLLQEVMNPNHLEFPYYNVTAEAPDPTDYMDEENKKEYLEQVDKGYNPNPKDFMSAEEQNRYNLALVGYQQAEEAVKVTHNRWLQYLHSLMQDCPIFEFNGCYLTPDGKKCIVNCITFDDTDLYNPIEIYTPWIIDIARDTFTAIKTYGMSVNVCYVPNNKDILASNGYAENEPPKSYVIRNGKITDLIEELGNRAPSIKDWIDEYMVHDFPIEGSKDYYEAIAGGNSIASEDLNVVAIYNDHPWNYYAGVAWGAIFDFNDFSSVRPLLKEKSGDIYIDSDGYVRVSGKKADVYVYDLQGKIVGRFSSDAAGPKLAKGAYIVKAVDERGKSLSAKLVR